MRLEGRPRGRDARRETLPDAEPATTIAVIGAGRCGTALALCLRQAGYTVTAVHSRSASSAARLAAATGARPAASAAAAMGRADLTLVTVPDGEISRVAATVAATGMALHGRAAVHCSGARPAAALAALRQAGAALGACHPLQALAQGAGAGSLSGVFFGIEADPPVAPLLERLVEDVGGVPFAAPDGDRALYHAAAILAGNAPLALLARAAELLEAAGVRRDVAGPALAVLLEGAARNARRLGPRAAMTGPAVRGDADTVRSHLDALAADPQALALYVALSREVLRTAGGMGREAVSAALAREPWSEGGAAAAVAG